MATETIDPHKTHVEQVRKTKPITWTLADQIQFDQKVKAEQLKIREARLAEKRASNLIKIT